MSMYIYKRNNNNIKNSYDVDTLFSVVLEVMYVIVSIMDKMKKDFPFTVILFPYGKTDICFYFFELLVRDIFIYYILSVNFLYLAY